MVQKNRAVAKFFMLNGDLHKKLFVNRSKDLLVAWNYSEHKKVSYNYKHTIDKAEPTYSMSEVCKMVGRQRTTLMKAIRGEHIRMPPFTYTLDEHRKKHSYRWPEESILELREYLSTIHRGRPRKDGEEYAAGVPSERELRAVINNDEILYIKKGDQFVPTWKVK
jgi:hypothetical protein